MHVDVVAELRRRQRPGAVVEQVAAGLDLGHVLRPRSAGSSPPSGRRRRAGRASPSRVTRTSYQVGRPWMLRGEDVARADRHAHAQDGLGEQLVGRGRARAVDVGELDDEIVDGFDAASCRPPRGCFVGAASRQPGPAWVMSSRNFCMSQAPVGQRSAHRPQCRQTSSSLAITRPVFSAPETYRSCVRFSAGAFSRVRRSASSPLTVKVMQSIGQMSTQASHSMHSCVGEHGLHVAVEAALRFLQRGGRVEAELDLDLDVLQRLSRRRAQGTLKRRSMAIVVVVAPLVDAHLLRHQVASSAAGARSRPRRAAACRSRPPPRGRGPPPR